MGYIVELGDNPVPVLGSCQAMDVMHLLATMDAKEEK